MKHKQLESLVISLKPDITPEEEARFVIEFARAIMELAQRLVARDEGDELPPIEF